MRILVIGSGGREHAIAWQLARHGHRLWCAPGNPGTARIAANVALDALDIAGLAALAERESVDLTVVGPEAPLVAGIADEFDRRGLAVFGPTARGARLEGDKAFAKELMRESDIPTARFDTFTDHETARAALGRFGLPVVVKASGLAAGKGAVVCPDRAAAETCLREMMVEGRFGSAGSTVVVEEFLAGEETSIIAVTDGADLCLTVAAQDHKRLEDGDKGPNTGGMGAYAPAPVADAALARFCAERVFRPLLKGLAARGIEYRGVVYAGMMLTNDGPKVLEFNCRFGDPETQAVLPLLESDLAELCLASARGGIGRVEPRWSRGAALCVVLASAGYPGSYPKGVPIKGPLEGDGFVCFHAGTAEQDGRLVTSGGRVLGVTGLGPNLAAARDRAYSAVAGIGFEGMHFRTDIGSRGLARLAGR